MINKFKIINSKVIEATSDDEVEWIELICPTEEEVDYIISKYNLPNDYIEDARDVFEVSRVEKIDKDNSEPALIMMLYPHLTEEQGFETYVSRPISMVLTEQVLITTIYDELDFFEDFKKTIEVKSEFSQNKEDLVLEIAWKISQLYIDSVIKIDREIDTLETKLRKSTKTEFLYKIISLQKSLVNFESSIEQNIPVIEALDKSKLRYNSDHIEDLYKDLHIENRQAKMMVYKSSKMLMQISNTLSSIMNNNLSLIVKIQTSITIVLTIPAIIGALWGMNVRLPFENNPNAFTILSVASLILCGISIGILKKNEYL